MVTADRPVMFVTNMIVVEGLPEPCEEHHDRDERQPRFDGLRTCETTGDGMGKEGEYQLIHCQKGHVDQ